LGRAPTDELLRELSATDQDSWSSVNEAMISWAEDLREAGYHRAILSNMPQEFHRERLLSFPWIDLFPVRIISGELGIAKPDAAIYREACRQVAHSPEVCLFLDDNPANADGARAVGMHAVAFRGPAASAPELARYGLPPLRPEG
jgi:putative hydrolase of the HAD superfamily